MASKLVILGLKCHQKEVYSETFHTPVTSVSPCAMSHLDGWVEQRYQECTVSTAHHAHSERADEPAAACAGG